MFRFCNEERSRRKRVSYRLGVGLPDQDSYDTQPCKVIKRECVLDKRSVIIVIK